MLCSGRVGLGVDPLGCLAGGLVVGVDVFLDCFAPSADTFVTFFGGSSPYPPAPAPWPAFGFAIADAVLTNWRPSCACVLATCCDDAPIF